MSLETNEVLPISDTEEQEDTYNFCEILEEVCLPTFKTEDIKEVWHCLTTMIFRPTSLKEEVQVKLDCSIFHDLQHLIAKYLDDGSSLSNPSVENFRQWCSDRGSCTTSFPYSLVMKQGKTMKKILKELNTTSTSLGINSIPKKRKLGITETFSQQDSIKKTISGTYTSSTTVTSPIQDANVQSWLMSRSRGEVCHKLLTIITNMLQ